MKIIGNDYDGALNWGSIGAVIMNTAGEIVHADHCDMEMLVPLIEYLYEPGCDVGLVHSVDYFDVFPDRERCRGDRAYTPDTMQNGWNVDIVRADVNKAKGLYRPMELVGTEYDDMITVGDNVNSYGMIKEFRSYAMESGAAEIRELDTFVTPGMAELIDRELATQKGKGE